MGTWRKRFETLYEERSKNDFNDMFFESIKDVYSISEIFNWNILDVECQWIEKVVIFSCVLNAKNGERTEEQKTKSFKCFQALVLEHTHKYFIHIHTLRNNSRPRPNNRRRLLSEIFLLTYLTFTEEQRRKSKIQLKDEKLKGMLAKEVSWMKDKSIKNLLRLECLTNLEYKKREHEVFKQISSFDYSMFIDAALKHS